MGLREGIRVSRTNAKIRKNYLKQQEFDVLKMLYHKLYMFMKDIDYKNVEDLQNVILDLKFSEFELIRSRDLSKLRYFNFTIWNDTFDRAAANAYANAECDKFIALNK